MERSEPRAEFPGGAGTQSMTIPPLGAGLPAMDQELAELMGMEPLGPVPSVESVADRTDGPTGRMDEGLEGDWDGEPDAGLDAAAFDGASEALWVNPWVLPAERLREEVDVAGIGRRLEGDAERGEGWFGSPLQRALNAFHPTPPAAYEMPEPAGGPYREPPPRGPRLRGGMGVSGAVGERRCARCGGVLDGERRCAECGLSFCACGDILEGDTCPTCGEQRRRNEDDG